MASRVVSLVMGTSKSCQPTRRPPDADFGRPAQGGFGRVVASRFGSGAGRLPLLGRLLADDGADLLQRFADLAQLGGVGAVPFTLEPFGIRTLPPGALDLAGDLLGRLRDLLGLFVELAGQTIQFLYVSTELSHRCSPCVERL